MIGQFYAFELSHRSKCLFIDLLPRTCPLPPPLPPPPLPKRPILSIIILTRDSFLILHPESDIIDLTQIYYIGVGWNYSVHMSNPIMFFSLKHYFTTLQHLVLFFLKKMLWDKHLIALN